MRGNTTRRIITRASDNDRTIMGWERGVGQGQHCHDPRGPFEKACLSIKIYGHGGS